MKETRVWGDAASRGQHDVIGRHVPDALNFIQAKAYRPRLLSETERAHNRTNSKVRSNVKPVFLVIRRSVDGPKSAKVG